VTSRNHDGIVSVSVGRLLHERPLRELCFRLRALGRMSFEKDVGLARGLPDKAKIFLRVCESRRYCFLLLHPLLHDQLSSSLCLSVRRVSRYL
jgi:hypothetical protein